MYHRRVRKGTFPFRLVYSPMWLGSVVLALPPAGKRGARCLPRFHVQRHSYIGKPLEPSDLKPKAPPKGTVSGLRIRGHNHAREKPRLASSNNTFV